MWSALSCRTRWRVQGAAGGLEGKGNVAPGKRKQSRPELEAGPDELGDDPGQVGAESAGLSGDAQGLTRTATSTSESMEELFAEGQFYEASMLEGIEEAEDNPERPLRTHSDSRPATIRNRHAAIPDTETVNKESATDNAESKHDDD